MTIYYIFDVIILKYIATTFGIILFLLEFRFHLYKKYRFLFLISLIVFTGLLMEILVTNTFIGINSFPLLFAHVGLALFLLRRKLNPTIISVIFWLCIGYFIFAALSGANPNLTLVSRSANHISTIMIFLTILLYISYLKASKQPGMLPALMTFLICLWAPGLSGFIATLILLMGVFLFVKKKKLDYVLLGVAILGVFLNFQYITENLSFHRKSFNFRQLKRINLLEDSQYLYEEPRYLITQLYFENLNLRTLFLGFDWPMQYYFYPDGNVHNSFLELHFRIGIFSIFIFIITIFVLFKAIKTNKFYFVLLIAILIRATTDTIILPNGLFDFIFYYLLTFILCEGKKRARIPRFFLKKYSNQIISLNRKTL